MVPLFYKKINSLQTLSKKLYYPIIYSTNSVLNYNMYIKLSSNFAQNSFLISSLFESFFNPFFRQSVLFVGLKIVGKIDGVICKTLY